MFSLLIETCTERGIVALMEDEDCSYFVGLPFGLHNSQLLVPKVEEAFGTVKREPEELDLIVVGVGPGSYTGIRLGATVAKSVSYFCRIPLVGIGTLETFTPSADGPFAAVIDAKMGGAYLQKGVCEEGKIRYITEPGVCPLDSLRNELEGIPRVVGPYFDALKKRAGEALPEDIVWEETASNPLQMLLLGREKFNKGEYSLDGSLELLYLRKNP